ncbi:MAG: SDR family oxidoreductase [Actinomycetes bacterium]
MNDAAELPPVLLVTGGGRGIGAATARLAAERGYQLCLTYREDAESAQQVVDQIAAGGGRAVAIRADVRDEGDVVAAFDAAAALGPLTAVVANAGIVAPPSDLADMGLERMRAVLEVNVLGALLTAREAVRRLGTGRGGAGGAIVLLSSVAARTGAAHEYVDYAAAKGAVDALTIGLAHEAAAEGVRVNTVRPGITATDIHARNGTPDRLERLGPQLPLGRPGSSDEVAAAILWLCSDEASYCTGSILDVAGGR